MHIQATRNPVNASAEGIFVTRRFEYVVAFVSVAVLSACSKSETSPSADAPAAAESAPRAAATPPVDLCSLVTEEEAEGVLKKPLAPPQKQANGHCWYLREGGTDFGDVEFILSFIAAYPRSEAEFHSFVADQVKEMNEAMKKAGATGAPFVAEPASGLDAPAYFIDPGLYVLTGNRILAVGLGGNSGLELARIALKRL
jgi:hypothetical protein